MRAETSVSGDPPYREDAMDADAKELIRHLFTALTAVIEELHDLAAAGQADRPDPAYYVAKAAALKTSFGDAQALAKAAEIMAIRAARG